MEKDGFGELLDDSIKDNGYCDEDGNRDDAGEPEAVVCVVIYHI